MLQIQSSLKRRKTQESTRRKGVFDGFFCSVEPHLGGHLSLVSSRCAALTVSNQPPRSRGPASANTYARNQSPGRVSGRCSNAGDGCKVWR